jgi:UDP-glucose 4-epimerase
MRDGVPATIFGDGSQTRDFVYVADVTRALIAASETGSQGVYNVGTGVGTTVLELHRRCAEVAGVPAQPVLADPRPGDLLHSVLDVSRAQRELGGRPQTSLEQGLALTWDAVRRG